MAEENDSVNVIFGANIDKLRAGASAASSAVKESVGEMKEHVNGLGESVEKLNGLFAAFAAALAGGAIFKEAISSVTDEADAVRKLSTQLGITTEKASELNITLSVLGISNDTYAAALQGVTKTLKTNEDAFTRNGVVIRDANGQLLDSQQIMQNTISFLTNMKDGTERNVAAMTLMGRGWRELTDLQRLNNEAMDKGSKLAHDLNQILGTENINNTLRYKEALNITKEITEALFQVIGEQLLPVVTSLGEWFGSIGPTVVEVFQVAIDGLADVIKNLWAVVVEMWSVVETVFNAFGDTVKYIFGNEASATFSIFVGILRTVQTLAIGFRVGMEEVFIAVGSAIAKLTGYLVTFGNVAAKALTGDFSGAKAAWKTGMDDIARNEQDAINRMVQAAEKGAADIAKVWDTTDKPNENKEAKPNEGKGGSFIPDPKKGKEQDRVAEWKAALEQMKLDEQDYFKDYTQIEIQYWEDKLRLGNLKSKEYNQIIHELYTLKSAAAKQELAAQLANYETEIAADKNNSGKKVAILNEELALIKSKYGERSKEYQAMTRRIADAERDLQEQQRRMQEEGIEFMKNASLDALDMKREELSLRKELGDISDVEELQALKQLKEEEYQIEYKAAQDKAALIQNDVEAQQKAYDQLEAMARKHAIDIKKIEDQSVIAQKNQWQKMLEPISNAFSQSIKGIIQGTTTLRQAMQNIFQSIFLSFVDMGVKMLTNWIAKQLGLTAATAAGTAARTTIEQTAADEGLAIQAASVLKKIANYAYETFAAVYQALAGIPFVGPFIAPAAAAAALGTVIAVGGSVLSAEGGFDIPRGVNPMVQLHEEEMVLPKAQANAVRNMADGGGSGGGDTHLHVHTLDVQGVKDFFKKNSHVIAPAVRNMSRNYTKVK